MSKHAVRKACRTAFVFAGGGSLGAAQVGILRALIESGIQPNYVVGTSVGAINAAYFAGDPTLAGVARMERLWLQIKRSDIFPLSWRRLIGFMRRHDALIPQENLQTLINTNLPFENLEDARIPLGVVATDIVTGEPVVLEKGPAARAILASSAIPGAFEPVEWGGKLLCDGALSSNTPIQAAAEAGATRLIILQTGVISAAPQGAVQSALRAITHMTTRQLASELKQLAPHVSYCVVPTMVPFNVSPFDFSASSRLIDQAYRNCNAWLESGGLAKSFNTRFAETSQSRLPNRLSGRRAFREMPHERPPMSERLIGQALPA